MEVDEILISVLACRCCNSDCFANETRERGCAEFDRVSADWERMLVLVQSRTTGGLSYAICEVIQEVEFGLNVVRFAKS